MKKEMISLAFLFVIISLAFSVSALYYTNISLDNFPYNIGLVSVGPNSATIQVNDEMREISPVQSSQPYYINNFSPTKPNISFVLTKAFVPSKIGDIFYVSLFIALEKKLTDENPITNLTIDGNLYQIEFLSADSNSVTLRVNTDLKSITPEQASQPYYLSDPVGGLRFVIKDISTANLRYSTTLLIGFYKNLTEECIENWNCTNWSSCSNNQQTRACNDKNLCGTNTSKPVESQSCNSPIPDIECYSDKDCIMEVVNEPYCEGNSSCINSTSYECINSGTEESYCKSTTTRNCNSCSDGCENRLCVNKTSPNPIPSKECEPIGLRQSEKYCSTEYKLITQKANNIGCDNDFECKTNICSENKCVSRIIPPNPDERIIWIIVGAIIVIAVIAIILFFIFRKKE